MSRDKTKKNVGTCVWSRPPRSTGAHARNRGVLRNGRVTQHDLQEIVMHSHRIFPAPHAASPLFISTQKLSMRLIWPFQHLWGPAEEH
jgi:hypothetical protein